MLKFALGLVAAFGIVTAANAVTAISSTNGPHSGIPAGQHLVTDFSTDAGVSASYLLKTGSINNQYATPYQDNLPFHALLGGESAMLALSPAPNAPSFYWGSVDAFNTVSFFSGSTLVKSYTGAQIPAAPADESQGDPVNDHRVNIKFEGMPIPSIRFASSTNSFVLDTVSGAAPEPTTWAL